jgi:hypothetical protein
MVVHFTSNEETKGRNLPRPCRSRNLMAEYNLYAVNETVQFSPRLSGDLAQMVERMICNHEVTRSILVFSIDFDMSLNYLFKGN